MQNNEPPTPPPLREGQSLQPSTMIGASVNAADLKDQAMIRNTVAAAPHLKRRQWPLDQDKMNEVFRAEQWALRKGLESGDAPLVNSVVRTFVGMHGQNQADEPKSPAVVINNTNTAIAQATATADRQAYESLKSDPEAMEALHTLRAKLAGVERPKRRAATEPIVVNHNGHLNGHSNGHTNGHA